MPPVLEVVQPQRGLVAAVSLLTPHFLGVSGLLGISRSRLCCTRFASASAFLLML